ncbi:MAG TPA: hypothetical protein VM537_09495, partial [Anaerolineae bacterium]|nr:hypothetical protein [Anaerolineae bacterium]
MIGKAGKVKPLTRVRVVLTGMLALTIVLATASCSGSVSVLSRIRSPEETSTHSLVAASTSFRQQLENAYSRLFFGFEANQGQNKGEVKFLSRGRGYRLFLTPAEAVLVL